MTPQGREMIVLRARAERRDRVVHARFSATEIAAIACASAEAGMTVSAFMRSLILEGAGIRPFFTEDDEAVLNLLLSEMRAIGSNINQLARVANTTRQLDATVVSDQISDVQNILAAVMLELRSFAACGARRRRNED